MRNLDVMTLAELDAQINGLSTVREVPVGYIDNSEMTNAENYKALINNTTNEVEAIVTQKYKVVPHAVAFGAIVKGLANINPAMEVRASVHEENGRAWMSTTFKDMTAFDGADGIELGFTALNSYNCSTALRYGGKQTNLFDNGHMEFFGLRLACMNGMTHKVKIDWNNLVVKDRSIAKIGDIVGVELDKVPDVEVARLQASRKHVGDMLAHIQKVEQMFAALPYVVKEMEMSVRQAKRSEISLQEAGKLLTEQGIGPEYQSGCWMCSPMIRSSMPSA